jgi:hypothetical protein
MGLTTAIKIKVSKLDRRHTGVHWFTHRVVFEGSYRGCAMNLSRAREWLWETFGPSREVGMVGYFPDEIPQWSWETDHSYFRIYLTEHALTQFLLCKDRFEKPAEL